MDISKIIDCDAVGCIYNRDKQCHTFAINIGDDLPVCDTFMQSNARGGFDSVTGGVGSCKVKNCVNNNSFECTCDGIHMHLVGNHVDCMNFTKK